MRAAREQPGLEVVAIGPMTNLARAFALEPKLPSLLGGVTLMGGHIREARIGSFLAPHGIDYNLCSDPEASLTVLGAGFKTTLVTADVTLQTWLRDTDVRAMAAGSELQREIARQIALWRPVAAQDLQVDRRRSRAGQRRLPARPVDAAGVGR